MTGRIVCWFSRGAASAVATKLVLREIPDAEVVCIGLTTEHPDSARFADDCERWFGRPITYLASTEYVDTWDVWERRRFLVGPQGAPCTGLLKKAVRHAWQRPDDLHVWGYTADAADVKRYRRLVDGDPLESHRAPLIERGLTKADVLHLVTAAGIELPAMYRLGYSNNNCIGCVKGGIGYWNAIRVDFPEVFDRMARLEREIGHAVLSEEIPGQGRTKRPVWLDELAPERGDFQRDQPEACSLNCAPAEVEIGAAS